MYNIRSAYFFFQIFLVSFCFCDLSLEKKDKLLNGFVEYYNRLPNQAYTCEVGYLQNAQKINENCYKIEVIIKAVQSETTKYFKCTTTLQELLDNEITVMNNEYQCTEQENYDGGSYEEVIAVTTTEEPFERRPVQLDNEVETNTGVTSGEQFVAIRRPQPNPPCIGCSTHINPQAAGVSELAALGAKQLDRHMPNVKHTVSEVLDVERQVQVVNGVRYILTLHIDFDVCEEEKTDLCKNTQTCKVTVLEKPWIRYGDGSKYRAILSNNCTEDWRFGDDGEVIFDISNTNKENNEIDTNVNHGNSGDDIIKPVHNTEVQSQQNPEKVLTDEDIKNIDQQVIPLSKFNENFDKTSRPDEQTVDSEIKKEKSQQTESTSLPIDNAGSSISDTKKKAIDDLLSFLDSAGFNNQPSPEANIGRIRRSYDNDLETMLLAERFTNIKQSINNAKHIYSVAQIMVDHLNEMDSKFKTKTLLSVLKAEEEYDGKHHYFYVQARVSEPCDKFECESKATDTKICNGVVDGTEKNFKVLSAFCSSESNISHYNNMEVVPIDDPVLKYLAKVATKKIEKSSKGDNAMKLTKILTASTQKVSGTLTKLSIILGFLNCSKTVLDISRHECRLQEDMGSKLCEVLVHEKHRMKDQRITYTCIDRPVHVTFSNKLKKSTNLDDPKINRMVQDALEYLEMQSSKRNKQKIVSVDSVKTQLNAGFLTEIDFSVGYTSCTNNEVVDINDLSTCDLLENEPLRLCKALIWDRSWIEDEAQIEVSCTDSKISFDDVAILKLRTKRSLDFVGGPKSEDTTDPQYKALAEESLKKFMMTSNNEQHYSVVNISSVTVQVVSGTLTRISFSITPTSCQIDDHGNPSSNNCEVLNSTVTANCNSEIWNRPWLEDGKLITVTCDTKDIVSRRLRRASVLGGGTEKDPSEIKYFILAEESLEKYLKTSGISKPHEVVKVNKATVQVVSGLLTRLEFTVSPTDGTGETAQCNSEVWEQPWVNKKDIKVECSLGNRSKRQITGAPEEKNADDPKYKILAQESLKKYLMTSGISKPHEVVKVDKVTVQVVSGSLTRLEFTVSPTDGAGETAQCKSEVWEQPWVNKKDIKVECSLGNRSKRQITGAPEEKNPDDPKYKILAQESLKKYLMTSGISKPHEVVKVDKVTVQVVSGSLTRLEFTVSPTDGEGETAKCYSEVWERPWLKNKEILVNCDLVAVKQEIKEFGRFIENDPSDQHFMIIAEEALEKYLSMSGIKRPHKVVQVNKVMTQVVAGMHTIVHFTVMPEDGMPEDKLTCRADIWEKVWLNNKEIDVECNFFTLEPRYVGNSISIGLKSKLSRNVNQYKPQNESYSRTLFNSNIMRKKREVLDDDRPDIFGRRKTISDESENNMVGNLQEKDPSKKEYKVLAQKSLQQYVNSQKINKAHRVIEVKRVRAQVVSGVRYKIDFKASPTNCSADIIHYFLERCKYDNDVILLCHANIWSRPWLGKEEINVSCNIKLNESTIATTTQLPQLGKRLRQRNRFRRQTNPDEDDIEDDSKNYYADAAIQRLNHVSDSHNLYKLVTIHTAKKRTVMDSNLILMYIEVAQTYCLRHADEGILSDCEELDGIDHKNCLARITPSPDDELIIIHTDVVCDDDAKFEDVTGISISKLLQASINKIESTPQVKNKLVHTGDPQWIPTLDPDVPVKLNFIVASTNCSKDVDYIKKRSECFYDISIPSKVCNSYIWLAPFTNKIDYVQASCQSTNPRVKRSFGDSGSDNDTVLINQLVQLSLDKLEMTSQHRYKQRLLRINSYSTKITSGKVTTIDFDIGYTSCLKYEWVENVTNCEFLEHLPRRHCVSRIWERLWVNNGRNIEVNCEDDETPLESHIEFESAEMGMQLAKEALKHIEAKYPNPQKQKVVRIFSLEKQVVAGLHYRMKIEVGSTNCYALSAETDCKIDKDAGLNKFCRVNVWLRPWTDHPPNFRVQCDYQNSATADVYRHVQAEYLFFNFMTTYKPEYVNDHREIARRFDIFKANIQKIHDLNIHERGTATYGITRFADLTYEEFSTKYMGLKLSLKEDNQMPTRPAVIPNIDIPENFDWRDYDAVTAVKDQGSCGSCWAFSVTGNVEGQWKMQSGQLLSFSEQELVDCDKLDQGCNGGLMDNAYRAIEQLGGLELENDYPYEGEDDKCVFNKTLSRVQISGAVNISSNETDMAKWLTKHGPISIGINANAMQFYMGGISHPWRMLCNPKNLDHGVLVVGYGIKDYPLFNKRLPYWIVKNSWGTSWGEQGYYRVFRGDGTCGVNQMASSAVI